MGTLVILLQMHKEAIKMEEERTMKAVQVPFHVRVTGTTHNCDRADDELIGSHVREEKL